MNQDSPIERMPAWWLARAIAILVVMALSLSLGSPAGAVGSPTPPPGPLQKDAAPKLKKDIEFDDASGKDAWKLDVTRSDVELEDGKDREIASYKIKAGRLRIKQGKSKVLGYVQPVSKKKGFRILDPSKKKTRFLLSPEPDGDWRLETKDGRVLLKIKKRESGFKIVSAKGDTRAKVKVRKGKTSLRDAKGKTTLSTRDPIPPLAAACLTLEPLSMPERVGLCLAIIQWGS